MVVRYSHDHLLQKWLVNFWHSCQRLSNVMDWCDSGESGKAVKGFPIRKCPGVNTSNASAWSGSGVSGLEFRHASTCASVVVNSS